jgi:hypothetical protein
MCATEPSPSPTPRARGQVVDDFKADFLDYKCFLDAISRVVQERVEGESRLTVGRIIVYKNRSGQNKGGLAKKPAIS